MKLTNRHYIVLLFDIFYNNELECMNEYFSSYIDKFKKLETLKINQSLILIKYFEQNYKDSIQLLEYFIKYKEHISLNDLNYLKKVKREIQTIYKICIIYIEIFTERIKEY